MAVSMERTEPPNFLDLPRELLHNIIVGCSPVEVAAFRATCRHLKATVDNDKLLYKDLYLRLYTKSIPELSQQVVHLVRLSQAPTVPFQALSPNMTILNRAFKDDLNREAFLTQSSLFAWASSHPKPHFVDKQTSQASAKLHVLYGAPLRPTSERLKDKRMDMYARSRVYDLRRYTTDSFWGPFFADRSAKVDWEKLQSIMLVVQYNLSQFHQRTSKRFPLLWHTPWAGIAPRSFVSPVDWRARKLERKAQARERGDVEQEEEAAQSEARETELREKDPYNVTGTWMRVVCFLDYSDLYSFNFSDDNPPEDASRPALDQEEAIRLITMKLRVTKIEPGGKQQLPGSLITHFDGTSRSMHVGWDPNANSGIRAWLIKGTVSTTLEGEIRWTSFSVFHGEERWRSEGVQIGGVNSARGVWGSWFDKDFDPEGPAGPTAFWKLTDELPPNDPENSEEYSWGTAHYHSQPLFVNNGMPNNRNPQRRHAGVGVFGAAATPDDDDDDDEPARAENELAAEHSAQPRNETQHPYNQTIASDDAEERDQVLLELQEIVDGEGVGAETILEILNAGGSSDEEDDHDYEPPRVDD
ncbi:MAG: hypothetical protein Q9159_004319 [Coniocarpon cinnabarinum]